MARGRPFVQNAQRRLQIAQARTKARGGAQGSKGPSPSPWDSQAMRESTELGNEAGDTRASLAAAYSKAQQNLGFGEGASNPYSQAAQLKQGYEANKRGIMNTAGNQLYAGSTVNAQSQARGQFDTGQKSLEDSYSEAQAAYGRGTGQIERDLQTGLAGIKEGAINRRLASEPEPLAVGAGRGRAVGRRPGREGQNIRRPQQARAVNARARALNARINRGRGR